MSSRNFRNEINRDMHKAFNEARKRKLLTTNEYRFESNFAVNIHQLVDDILARRYKPSRSIAFINTKPVYREIFAAPFIDRVAHHYLIGHVEPWWDRHFIYDSYSCRKGKGTDLGIRRLYHMMRKVSDNFHHPTYICKFDLQGYFTSLPRDRLFKRAIWGLDRQFFGADGNRKLTTIERERYETFKFLWRQFIFDEPTQDAIIRGDAELWTKLPKRKSLFFQEPGLGIVIGNLTSQVLSNIYLDQLDRYISITLGYKNYGRYVDDFFVVLREEQLRQFIDHDLHLIEDFVIGLGLALHPEKRIVAPIEHGIEFLGAKIYPYHIHPSERLINNYKNDLFNIVAGEKDFETLASYLGRLQHFDSQHLQKRLWDLVGLDYKMERSGPSARYYTDPKDYERTHPYKHHPAGRLSASGLYISE